jgi:N-acetylmuramoyl-L-alanine amidase
MKRILLWTNCILLLLLFSSCSGLIPGKNEEAAGEEIKTEEPAFVDVLPDMTVSSLFPADYKYEPLPTLNESARDKLIVIDPGHGGIDVGSIYREGMEGELFEKDIDLAIALRLKDFLEAAGAKIYMIRDTDVYVYHRARGGIANEVGGDLFISIHNNASQYSHVQGTEVWFYDKVDAYGRTLEELYGISSHTIASAIQNELLAALGTADRELRTDVEMAVLARTSMPAVAVEGAYMTNPDDIQLILADEYADIYAYAVAKALIGVMNEAY